MTENLDQQPQQSSDAQSAPEVSESDLENVSGGAWGGNAQVDQNGNGSSAPVG